MYMYVSCTCTTTYVCMYCTCVFMYTCSTHTCIDEAVHVVCMSCINIILYTVCHVCGTHVLVYTFVVSLYFFIYMLYTAVEWSSCRNYAFTLSQTCLARCAARAVLPHPGGPERSANKETCCQFLMSSEMLHLPSFKFFTSSKICTATSIFLIKMFKLRPQC